MSNGHGAVAITRFLPEIEQGVERPSFVVWQNGVQSAELEGLPITWDSAGDRLEILHPTVGNMRPQGWTEVLAWPDLKRVFATDPQSTGDGGDFDPTGQYLAGINANPTSADAWQMAVEVTNLSSGSVSTIPIQGDPTKAGGGYVWNDQGQIVTIGQSDRTMTTYSADGKQVSQMPAPPGVAVVASANGRRRSFAMAWTKTTFRRTSGS